MSGRQKKRYWHISIRNKQKRLSFIANLSKMACFNSGHRIEDHFADISKMIEIGKGGRRVGQRIPKQRPVPRT
ncbi:hypothetical protein KAR34_02720 [bacterium]|nr:hypothetical protein [bacterium]